jgi:hypothetical protein
MVNLLALDVVVAVSAFTLATAAAAALLCWYLSPPR